MRKIFILTIVALFAFTANVNAQKYFTYDGTDFNVYLKCSSDNSRVLEVHFTDASKSEWIQFSIADYESFEDTEAGGFTYTVNDGIFYLRSICFANTIAVVLYIT